MVPGAHRAGPPGGVLVWGPLVVTGPSSGAVLSIGGTLTGALRLGALLPPVARLGGPPRCRCGVLLGALGGGLPSRVGAGLFPVSCLHWVSRVRGCGSRGSPLCLWGSGSPSDPGCRVGSLVCPVQGEMSVLEAGPPPCPHG